MALGTNQQTVTTGNVFRPNVWANEVMEYLYNSTVLLNLVKRYDAEVSSMGQSVEIPFMSSMVANDKVANTQVTLNAGTPNPATKISLLINKHKEASVVIEDILKTQSKYDMRSEFTSGLGSAVGIAIDNDIYSEFTGGAVTQTVGTFGTSVSDATILAGKVLLDNANSPQTDRSIVVNPTGQTQFLSIDKYVRYDALGTGKAIEDGKLGTIYGFTVYMATNIATVAGTPPQNTALMFQKNAVAVAMQQKPRTQAQYKQEHLGWLLTVDTIYGVKTIRANHAVLLKY